MILKVHVDGAPSYEIGNEIWQQSLAEAIREEAEIIADHAAPAPLESTHRQERNVLEELIVAAMTESLAEIGDNYRAADGVLFSLAGRSLHDCDGEDKVDMVVAPEPVVEEVVRFEDLPMGSSPTRRAVVRWSDGTESEPLRWYADLCGCPHNPCRVSRYAEKRRRSLCSGGDRLETSA